MTGTTSSTPEPSVEVWAGGQRLDGERRVEVAGYGDLRVLIDGCAPEEHVELSVGDRTLALQADADGRASWTAPGLLGALAGEVHIEALGVQRTLLVRPSKLTAELVEALVEELERVAEGLALAAGGRSSVGPRRSRDQDLEAAERAVGLAASAAPAIRRRPLHRARERVRAVPRDVGPRTARDVRWLATHPVEATRVSATGREVGVARTSVRDLDTLENRGVLSAYDRIDEELHRLDLAVATELERLERARPAREAFLTATGSLWSERDAPRVDALERRAGRLEALASEASALRRRAGLPDLRPRGRRMVRTPRVDSEPAYWTTFQAFQLAEQAAARAAPPVAPAPVGDLDTLWEQWCTVAVAGALGDVLGPGRQELVDRGWFASLRHGEVASWQDARRTVRLLYEPEYPFAAEVPRKLHPGRPWRPDLVVEVRWADGTLDLHVLDAKFRTERGEAPWGALQEVWFKYADGIGDADGMPVVRSVWVLWPGHGIRLVGPAMLDPRWPIERARGGALGLRPGASAGSLTRVLTSLLA